MQLVAPESPPNMLMAKSAGILQTTLFCSLESPPIGLFRTQKFATDTNEGFLEFEVLASQHALL